ncbi:S41 family peptidase [Thalassobacillus hwangdonensis]|uniref:S41 family peptidase n=1 Tax=Thalassobacillus hwangdonensis TaxID=546108 RepID=A0ABW3L0Y0_9BACI
MYLEIFNEVVDIMHHDYAGWRDKKGWDNPKEFEKKVKNLEEKGEIDAYSFTEIVEDYLLDFKDPHMYFKMSDSNEQKEVDNGFSVRRFDEKLFVTSVGQENRLAPGDAILSLDALSIHELVEQHQGELMETKAERENWKKALQNYSVADVVNSNGEHRLLDLKKYEKKAYAPIHTITRLDEETLYLKATDFFEKSTIDTLIAQFESELTSTQNLIIDVRVNYGGSTLAYASLENYLFPATSMKIDYLDYATEFNCTDRNAELMIGLIDQELAKTDNQAYRKGLERFKEEAWVKNKGKGFTSFSEDNEEIEKIGCELPATIIVLTDTYCGSAGDIFVYLCKKSPKVIVVGRPTMGVNDYSNLTTIKWNEKFEFSYPTSRLKSLDYRGALMNPGIQPDVYIPWTPEHIYKDVDLEEAMRILRRKNLFK